MRHTSSNDWISFIYISILVLMVAGKYINTNEFSLFFKFDFLKSYFEEKNRLKQQIIWFDLILFVITVSTLSIGLMQSGFLSTNTDFANFSQIGLFIALLIILKSILELFISIFIKKSEIILNYILFKIASLSYTSLIILPFIAILSYNDFNIFKPYHLIFSIFILINLVFIGNFTYTNRKHIFQDWYYFILYICSLEIAPLIISYNWLNS